MSREPQKNEQAPIREKGQLSPPGIRKPIYECAKSVHVLGYVPHALVKVYAGGTEVVGTKTPYTGEDDVALTRALKKGEAITATQTAFGFTSDQTYVPIIVQPQPTKLDPPSVGPTIYACGQVVPVGNLTASTHVEVYSAATQPVAITPANLIGTGESTGLWLPVVTQPLKKGWFVVARQVSCLGTNHELDSLPTPTALQVPSEPSPVTESANTKRSA